MQRTIFPISDALRDRPNERLEDQIYAAHFGMFKTPELLSTTNGPPPPVRERERERGARMDD